MFCVLFRTKFLGHKGFLLNLENIFYALLHQKIGIFCGTKNYMRATVVTNPLKQRYLHRNSSLQQRDLKKVFGGSEARNYNAA